jgi:tetratricopeptide (TPR) repeat protein
VKALVILIALAITARADDPKLAERYFHYGERAYKQQDFEAAATYFEQAYKAMPLPEIAFSAAQAYRRQYHVSNKAEQVARALELYRAYLDKIHAGGRVADAADAIAEMQRELDRLIKSGVKVSAELAAEHTRLGVNVTIENESETRTVHEVEDTPVRKVPGLVVTIDGANVRPDAPTNVKPGTHAIHVEADGFESEDKTVDVTQGDFHMVDVALRAKPAHLAITTPARVAIDGRIVGEAPLHVDVAAGKHLIALLHDGRDLWAKDVSLERGQDLALAPELSITTQRRWTERIAIAGAAAGVVTLAAMTVAIVEDSRASSLNDAFMKGDQPPSKRDAFNSEIRWRNAAIDGAWLFGALTVVAAGATVVLYYTDKPTIAFSGRF